MANYTQVPNYILSLLYGSGLNGSEAAVFAYLIRKTAGFHKASDKISYSQIYKATNMSESSAVRAVKSLEERGLISVKRKGRCTNIITVASVKNDRSASVRNDAKPLSDLTDTKESTKAPSSGALLGAPLKEKEEIKYSEVDFDD